MNKRIGFPYPPTGAAFALMIAVSCMTAFAAEPWRQIPGLDTCQAEAEALLSHDNVLLLGTTKGVFRSTNGGREWKPSNAGLTDLIVLSLATNGSSLFAGTLSGGVFRSIDQGQTWTHSNIRGQVRAIAAIGANVFVSMDPLDTTRVRLYRSTDNGETWAPADPGMSGSSLITLAAAGADLFAGTESGTYRSTDLGKNWSPVNARFDLPGEMSSKPYFDAFAVWGKSLLARTNFGVLVSDDNGVNWRMFNRGPSDIYGQSHSTISALIVRGDSIYAGTYRSGVFRYDNRNQNWTAIKQGLDDLHVFSLVTNGGSLFVGTRSCVHTLTDQSDRWNAVNSGLPSHSNHRIEALSVKGKTLQARFQGKVYTSDDLGQKWTRSHETSIDGDNSQSEYSWRILSNQNRMVVSIAAIDNVFLAGSERAGVLRSTDQGRSWKPSNEGLPIENQRTENQALLPDDQDEEPLSIVALAVSGEKVFAGTSGHGVFVSTDQGKSWRAINRGSSSLSISAMVAGGEKLFAVAEEGGLLISRDQGRNWSATGVQLRERRIQALAVSGPHLLAGTEKGIYFSTDDGRSWEPARTDFADPSVGSFVSSGVKLYAGTQYGVFSSADQGRSWAVTGFKEQAHSLAAGGGRLLAGTYNGVLLSTDDGQSWAKLGGELLSRTPVHSLAMNGRNILAGTSKGEIFLSPDVGENWTMVNEASWTMVSNRTGGIWVNEFQATTAGGDRLVAGTDAGIFISIDRGQKWRQTRFTEKVYCLAVSGSTVFAGTGFGVLASTDDGQTWSASNEGLPSPILISAILVKGARIYLGSTNGVFVSTNQGRSWTPFNEGLTDLDVRGFEVSDDYLVLRTHEGRYFVNRSASFP